MFRTTKESPRRSRPRWRAARPTRWRFRSSRSSASSVISRRPFASVASRSWAVKKGSRRWTSWNAFTPPAARSSPFPQAGGRICGHPRVEIILLIILLFGPPGCGKGTQGRMIADWLKTKIPVISTGDMLRAEIAADTPLGNQVKSIVAGGGLVSDDLVNQILEARISQPDCANGFMLDGYPRTLDQA